METKLTQKQISAQCVIIANAYCRTTNPSNNSEFIASCIRDEFFNEIATGMSPDDFDNQGRVIQQLNISYSAAYTEYLIWKKLKS